jgi:hypothetical protein
LKDAPGEIQMPVTKPAEIVAGMPQPPLVKHGMAQAFYSPHEDCVGMPERERFDGEAGYFATLFHELIHATGHEKRLKRASLTERNGFGSDPYCKEELIAELGSAFLCGYADIVERTIDNSAAYVEVPERPDAHRLCGGAGAEGGGLHSGPDIYGKRGHP